MARRLLFRRGARMREQCLRSLVYILLRRGLWLDAWYGTDTDCQPCAFGVQLRQHLFRLVCTGHRPDVHVRELLHGSVADAVNQGQRSSLLTFASRTYISLLSRFSNRIGDRFIFTMA